MEEYDPKRYRLITGIAVKELKRSKDITGESVSNYLRKINGSYTIANIIYNGRLPYFNLSQNGSFSHVENRYTKPTFHLLDLDLVE